MALFLLLLAARIVVVEGRTFMEDDIARGEVSRFRRSIHFLDSRSNLLFYLVACVFRSRNEVYKSHICRARATDIVRTGSFLVQEWHRY